MILSVGLALADGACPALETPPERLQVAWVSPERERAGAHELLPVVSTRALLALAEAHGGDPSAVLQALGARRPAGEWKVTVFDVERAELCRPVEGEGALDGLNRCDRARRPGWVRPRAWTGCGTVGEGADPLAVYGIEWADAADQGFCVLPLGRFLAGPPR